MSKGIVLDIETDALDATQIHCIVTRDVKTNEIMGYHLMGESLINLLMLTYLCLILWIL